MTCDMSEVIPRDKKSDMNFDPLVSMMNLAVFISSGHIWEGTLKFLEKTPFVFFYILALTMGNVNNIHFL